MSWARAKLSEVAPAKPLKKVKHLDDDNVLQITLDHIESGTGRLLKHIHAPVNEAGNSTHWFDNRHVLYSKLRPYLNKVYLPNEAGIGTTELVPMLPNEKILDRNYLAYYLKSKAFVDWVSSQTAGAKMPRVSMKVFWDYEIPLPPLIEQKHIAAILDKADAIRRKRQQAIQLADEFLRAVFLEMFGDPVTNPKGWEKKKIGDFLYVKNGYAFKSEYFTNSGELMLLTPGNFHETGGYRERGEKQKYYNGTVPDGYILSEGDILLAMTEQAAGLLGSSLVVPQDETYLHNQRLGLLKYNQEVVDPAFLAHMFNVESIRKAIHATATGLKVRHTSPKKIEEIEVGLPGVSLQRRFSSVFQKIESINRPMKSFSQSSVDSFYALSQKAFSGEL